MKCKDCACYKNEWCSMVTDSPDPDMERDCGHFIRAQRWIPVTERMPEQMEWVLAFTRGRRKYQVVRYDNIMDDWDSTIANKGFIKPHVTHWMPLPEPPEVSE